MPVAPIVTPVVVEENDFEEFDEQPYNDFMAIKSDKYAKDKEEPEIKSEILSEPLVENLVDYYF